MRAGTIAAAAAAFQGFGGGRLLRAAANRWALEDDHGGRRLRRRSAPPFTVLLYHRVHPNPTPFMIDALPPERFERQMRHLARSYRPMPLEELVIRSLEGTVPRGAVAVTFDDGYADNASHALPILRRYGIPATLFLATGCIGSGRIPWHDQVLLAFASARRKDFPLPIPGGVRLSLATEADRAFAASHTLEALKPLPERERLAAVAAIRGELGAESGNGAEAPLMLDWDQVRAMRRAGVRFGAHTVSHPILSRVTPERARDEVVESKRAIERELGEEVTLFAYPNGRAEDFTDETVSLLRAAGFRAAVTASFGANESGSDPFRFRRGRPWETDAARFALKLAYVRLRSEREAV